MASWREANRRLDYTRTAGEHSGAAPAKSLGRAQSDRRKSWAKQPSRRIVDLARGIRSSGDARGRVRSLRGSEPWPGYDELAVEEVRAVLDEGDETRIKRVRSYERSHKNRKGVIEATDRESVKA